MKVHRIAERLPGDDPEEGSGKGIKGELRRLQRLFDGELLRDFVANGRDVIEKLREKDPAEYVKVIARRLPAAVDVDGGVEIIIRHFAVQSEIGGKAEAADEGLPDQPAA